MRDIPATRNGRPPDVRVQTGQTVIYFSTRLAYGFPINSPATMNSADALLQTIGIFKSCSENPKMNVSRLRSLRN
jgi:hypothetical protein